MVCKFVGASGNIRSTLKPWFLVLLPAEPGKQAGTGAVQVKVAGVLPPFGTEFGRAVANTDLGRRASSVSEQH